MRFIIYRLGYAAALTCRPQRSEEGRQHHDHAQANDDEGGRVEVLELVDDVHPKANHNQAEQLSNERERWEVVEAVEAVD